MIAGTRPGQRWLDRLVHHGGTSVGIAVPNFWLGDGAAHASSPFGSTGSRRRAMSPLTESPVEWARHLILPALTLALAGRGRDRPPDEGVA